MIYLENAFGPRRYLETFVCTYPFCFVTRFQIDGMVFPARDHDLGRPGWLHSSSATPRLVANALMGVR